MMFTMVLVDLLGNSDLRPHRVSRRRKLAHQGLRRWVAEDESACGMGSRGEGRGATGWAGQEGALYRGHLDWTGLEMYTSFP